MFRISIEDHGLTTRLTGIASRARNISSTVWEQVGGIVIRDNQARLEAKGMKKSGKLSQDIKVSSIGADHVEVSTGDNKYAVIQNFGGFIKASPVTVTRRFNPKGTTPAGQRGAKLQTPIQTYQMARFMWAKWYETGDSMWRAMAISVMKKGGVQLKPQHFWGLGDKAKEDIEKLLMNYLLTNNENFPTTIQ